MTAIRRVFVRGLIVALLGGTALAYWVHHSLTSDSEVRRQVLAWVRSQYPHLLCGLSRASLDLEGGRIDMRGLWLAGRQGFGHSEMLNLPQLTLRVDPVALRQRNVIARDAVLRRPRLRAVRQADGHWNLAQLFPLPRPEQAEGPLPELRIEQGSLELIDQTRPTEAVLVLRGVDLHFIPLEGGRYQVEGTARGDYLDEATISGQVDVNRSEWSLEGLVETLRVGPELFARLPEPLAGPIAPLQGLAGSVGIRYALSKRPAARQVGSDEPADRPGAFHYEVTGSLAGGRFESPAFPFVVNDLRGPFVLRNGSIGVEFHGRNGATEVSLSGDARLEPGGRGTLHVDAKRLPIDERLHAALPASWQRQWNRWRPAGLVNVELDLTRVASVWQPQELTITSLGTSFRYHRFPYLIERVEGKLHQQGQQLDIDLVGHAGARPLVIRGRILRPGAEAQVDVSIAGDKIPIDRKLADALSEKHRRVVREFNPQGTLNFRGQFSRAAGPNQPVRPDLTITLNRCSILYDRFPYPVDELTGELVLNEGRWEFRDLEGRARSGSVTGNGSLDPPERGGRFEMTIDARRIALEEALKRALPARWQQVWDDVSPRGKGDITAVLSKLPGQRLQVSLPKVQPLDATVRIRQFPYEWNKVAGLFSYENNQIFSHKVSAEHRGVQLQTHVRVQFPPEGGCQVLLSDLNVEELEVDRELREALPEGLRRFAEQIHLQGPIGIHEGELGFQWSDRSGAAVRSGWNATLVLAGNSFHCGDVFRQVHGTMTIAGSHDVAHTQVRGTIDFGSLSFKGLQLTRLRGPLDLDNKRLRLGTPPSDVRLAKRPGRLPDIARNHLVGRLLGGTLRADAEVILGERGAYRVRGELFDAQLERYAKEYLPGRQRGLAGKLHGKLELVGGTGGAQNFDGRGLIQVRQAKLYELPLVVELLSVLSLRLPDDTAFTAADVDFRLAPSQIHIDRMDLKGDAVSLSGEGTMDYDQRVAMTFYTLVGRDELRIPLVTDILGEASKQLMAINVTGTLNHPNAAAEAMPEVTKSVRRLLGELGPR